MQTLLKKETKLLLNTYAPSCTHALTLQMHLHTLNATERRMDKLNECAVRATRQFISRLAYKAFGNGAKRKPNLYHPLVITAIEGTQNTYDKNKSLHAHIALGNILTENSNIKTEEQLRQIIRETWLATDYGKDNIDIKKMQNNGWITYITKEMQNGNMECVSWENTHTPNAALFD
jgi:hypothetical protein